MRGHTQARLMAADDGCSYVIKHLDNPFGSEALIAEYVGTQLLQRTGLPVSNIVLATCYAMTGDCPSGLHFGSRYLGDPSTSAVYDYLPTVLLARMHGWRHCAAGAFVFDTWVMNAAMRQNVFIRECNEWHAYFIDNTHVFGGPGWTFQDTGVTGVLSTEPTMVGAHCWRDLAEWSERIQPCIQVLDAIRRSIPTEWLTPMNGSQIDRVFTELHDRAKRLHRLVWAKYLTSSHLG